jgi:hypothetical protein
MFREWNLAEEVACRIKGAEDMPAAWKVLDAIYGNPLALTMDQAPELGRMPELQEEESGEESEAGMSKEEPAPLQARGAAAFRIVDAEVTRPAAKATNGPQKWPAWDKAPKTPLDTRRGARAHGREPGSGPEIRLEGRKQAAGNMDHGANRGDGLPRHGLRDVPADGRPTQTHRASLRTRVNSVEEFCSMPIGTTDECEIQLGKNHVELLGRLCKAQPHRTGASLSERWGETIRRFPPYAEG